MIQFGNPANYPPDLGRILISGNGDATTSPAITYEAEAGTLGGSVTAGFSNYSSGLAKAGNIGAGEATITSFVVAENSATRVLMKQEWPVMTLKIGTCILAFTCLVGTSCRAKAQTAEARQLMQATNDDRAQHGLEPLRWDPALARAAQAHADQMVRHGELSHQYAGEPELVQRAGHNGAHFSTVAENIAVAASPQVVESEWMHSPPHRHNILDPRLTTIGIGLVRQGNNLWAVEDFSAAVAQMGSTQIEHKVEQLVAERGIRTVSTSSAARQTCAMDHGFAGQRPNFVMRWEGSDLNRLPDVLEQKISTGRYRTAAVGACGSGNRGQGFTSYRLAVLLF